MKQDIGHWKSRHEFDISKYHGFVYEILEKDSGKKYIGKTKFWRVEKKKPGKYKKKDGKFVYDKKGKRVLETRTTRTHTKVETNWREYISSAGGDLREKIVKNKNNYDFTMLYFGTSEMDLKIKEAYVQIQYYMDGRWSELYNEQIDLRGYVPR